MKNTFYLLTILSLIFVGCKKENNENKPVEKVKYVVTEPVKLREMSQIFETDAILEPAKKINHKLKKSGTIENILKKNGETVKKGELIVEIDDSETKSNYLSAKANYLSSEAKYKIAKNNYENFKSLYKENLISYLEYIEYENNYINLKGNFESDKANYENAKSNYEKLFRRAEIDGIIGELFGKVGNDISENEILFTIIGDKIMETYVGFPAEFLSTISVGKEVIVEIPVIRKKLTGKILEINPTADTVTKKYKIKIGIDNKDKLIKDGMYSYITIPAENIKTLAVKSESIFVRDLLSYVYKVENGKVTRVEVKTGVVNPPYVAILAGNIKEGDQIVVDGIFGLEEGDKVIEKKSDEVK